MRTTFKRHLYRKMTKEEAETILRKVQYWHYPFELPWGQVDATKHGHSERHWLRRQHFFKPLLDLYGGSLSNKRVLDLACCQGFWSFEAARAGVDYCLGIDSSKDFIMQAEALRTLYELHNCEFRLSHLEKETCWSGLKPFHITLFLGLFYHLTDPIYVLRKAMNCTLETLIVDTEIEPRDDSALVIVPRDPQEPTTHKSNLSSSIRVVPTRAALYDLLKDGGFAHIEFLSPDPNMPLEYRTGHRVTMVARRKQ